MSIRQAEGAARVYFDSFHAGSPYLYSTDSDGSPIFSASLAPTNRPIFCVVRRIEAVEVKSAVISNVYRYVAEPFTLTIDQVVL